MHRVKIIQTPPQTRQTRAISMSSVSLSTGKTAATQNKANEMDTYGLINNIMMVTMIIFGLCFLCHCIIGLFTLLHSWFGDITDCGIWPNLQLVWWHSNKCMIYNILTIRYIINMYR